jgi:hypothetical protein
MQNDEAIAELALQRAFFPDGLVWNGAGFGTAVTCLAFNTLRLTKVEDP